MIIIVRVQERGLLPCCVYLEFFLVMKLFVSVKHQSILVLQMHINIRWSRGSHFLRSWRSGLCRSRMSSWFGTCGLCPAGLYPSRCRWNNFLNRCSAGTGGARVCVAGYCYGCCWSCSCYCLNCYWGYSSGWIFGVSAAR